MGQQEETRSIAAHDSLTKIYNFTAFCESSRKYLLSAGAGRSMGVIYANIIDFKSVNELYGLPEGDRMLGAFADFLKHLPRTRVCGRIFSDNFLCLFERTPGVDLYDEALGFAGAVERFLVGQQPFHPRSKPQIVSGISALEGGGEGLSAAIDGANIAHKEAKKKYRTACAVFDEALKDEMARAIRLQADLQAALEREQFTFYLQPKVNLRTGRVAGAEALARWKKPDGTVAGPAEFVPLLERTGNVEQLDFMIYEQVSVREAGGRQHRCPRVCKCVPRPSEGHGFRPKGKTAADTVWRASVLNGIRADRDHAGGIHGRGGGCNPRPARTGLQGIH